MGGTTAPRRLPFHFQAHGGVGRLTLGELAVGLVTVDKLELEVSELGTDPGSARAERFQRRRTRLRALAARIAQPALDERIEQVKKQLAGTGITQLSARLGDGYVSVRARAADGLAAADLSFHIELVSAGAQLRALASTIRIHGHLPTPGPVIADRLLVALTGAVEAGRSSERPYPRGLCDVEFDLIGALLWQVLPPSGWRLPAVSDIELTHVRVARAGIEVAYGPAGTRAGEPGVGKHALQLAAAHDLMHSVDDQLRGGHLEDTMRGYRALLASGGPDQPLLLERILALAAARPAWFPDGLELARQALGRWPTFAPAHAALASITLAQGDAREAARHLEDAARMASAGGDDDQAALAALAAARLLRVLDPRAATQLYQLALEHDPTSAEAADSLTDRLADEQRWSELVRRVRARIALADPPGAVQLHLRLADVFIHQLGDRAGAERELATARELAPDDPAVHEMTATILAGRDPAGAAAAWREVARLAELRGDHRLGARAHARLGDLLADPAGEPAPGAAENAWRRALELDPMQSDALVGLASAGADRNDHAIAAELYERLRGLGLPQAIAARHELALARSLIALGRTDEARGSLRRATLAGGEPAAEAHAVLAELADATLDRDHAASELDTAIASLVDIAAVAPADADRLYTRAAQLAVERAMLFDRDGQPSAAGADWQRAHALARQAAPEIARDAARTLLARSGDDAGLERRWIDAVLATRPPPSERAALLVRRADVRRRERFPDLAAALADLHEAVELTEELAEASSDGLDAPEGPDQDGVENHDATEIRRNAYQLEAELFAQSGDQRARAQSLAAIARLAERAADRVESEAAAAAAWLAADEPAAALPHGARAHASLASTTVPATLRREVLVTLGEAAWRQRAWPDVIRAYRGLLDDPGPEAHRQTTFRYRLAVAADRQGDAALALGALRPLIDDPDATRGASPELRSHALRLFADLAERAGELAAAAAALEGFAAIGGESTAPARADAVYRAGELFRRLDRGDDAIRCFETALRISDSHLPALDALEVAWRERDDLERVATILGRKVAATARQPGRQKPLLSRLGDLQDQLGRPDVALATHQRALEIDPMWRPSLRHVTLRLRDAGQVVAASGGLAQLAGELHGDQGVDLAIVTRERQIAAEALSALVAVLDDAQLEAVRSVARPALERAALDNAGVASGLARLRGETTAAPTAHSEAETHSGRMTGRIQDAGGGAQSLRDAAARARAAGKLEDALATLETANHVHPGDPAVLRELVEIATQLHDHAAAAHHLGDLADALTGPRRGDALLELADIFYDRLEDAVRGREAMHHAAEAFGSGSRRDATLRLLAAEAGAHLAWDVAVEALLAIPGEKRTQADLAGLATALMRAGRDVDAMSTIEAATAAGRFDDDGELLGQIQREIQRKIDLARSLEERAAAAIGDEAAALLDEAQQLRLAIGQPGSQTLRDLAAPEGEAPKADTAPWPVRTKTKPGLPNKQVPPAPAAPRTRAATAPRVVAPVVPAHAASTITLLDPDHDVRSSPSIDLAEVAAMLGGAAAGTAVPVPVSDSEQTARRSSPAIATPGADQLASPAAARGRGAVAIADEEPPPAVEPPDPPGDAASSSPASSTLGRIKLVPRSITRPRIAVPRPEASTPAPRAGSAPPETDEASGDWQSVSNPQLRSGPWLPPSAAAPPPPPSTRAASRRATTQPPTSASEPPRAAAASAIGHEPATPGASESTANEFVASEPTRNETPHARANGTDPARTRTIDTQATGPEPTVASSIEAGATSTGAVSDESARTKTIDTQAIGPEPTRTTSIDTGTIGAEIARTETIDTRAAGPELTSAEPTRTKTIDTQATDAEAAYLEPSDAQTTGAQATDAELARTTTIDTGAEMAGAQLARTTTIDTRAEIARAETAGVEIAGTEIAGAEMADAEEIAGAEMAGAETAGAETAGAEIAGAEIPDAEIAGAEIAGTEIAGAEIAGAEIAVAEIADAEIPDAEIPDAEIPDAEIPDAEIPDAEIADAEIADAEMAGAEMAGAEMAGAEIADAEIAGAEEMA
ncbi:MAG TPA: hypothetical protein VHW23_36490, partial [Kofleriaceae bacterium]|nr:hypothetical protein [Kofleriaceae bacterium]